jgi:hypothetical protein
MASNPGVTLPNDLSELLAQRVQTWADHDAATRSATQLERLASKVPAGASGRALSPLSPSGQPPDELAAAVQSLDGELHAIDQLQKDLEAAERLRFQTILVGAIVALIAILVAVAALTRH